MQYIPRIISEFLPWSDFWWFRQRLCKTYFSHKPVRLFNPFTLKKKKNTHLKPNIYLMNFFADSNKKVSLTFSSVLPLVSIL